MNNVTVNKEVYKLLFKSLLSVFLGIYLELELLDHMVILFNFSRNHHTIFHSYCIILHSDQWSIGFNVSIHANTYFLLFRQWPS